MTVIFQFSSRFAFRKTRHYHNASGDKSEDHDKVEAIFERTDETVQRSSAVCEGGIRATAEEQNYHQRFSPLRDEPRLPERKSLNHYKLYLCYHQSASKSKLLLLFCSIISQ
jgi:hypothetical protein